MDFENVQKPAMFLDFDGVLLNSNKIKEEAFFKIAHSHFGRRGEVWIEQYRAANPGSSREKVFRDLVDNFNGGASAQIMSAEFSQLVIEKLVEAEKPGNLLNLIKIPKIPILILSAAPERELVDLTRRFGWLEFFQNKILGSSKSKAEHLADLRNHFDLPSSILVGDSRSDLEVSLEFGLKFVFIAGWTDWGPNAKELKDVSESWPSVEEFLVSSTIANVSNTRLSS